MNEKINWDLKPKEPEIDFELLEKAIHAIKAQQPPCDHPTDKNWRTNITFYCPSCGNIFMAPDLAARLMRQPEFKADVPIAVEHDDTEMQSEDNDCC